MISIIIPNYNSANTLNKCINSVLKVKNINYEIIIVDDGSTDESINIIKYYNYNFDNIHAYYQSSLGVSSARNLGLEKSTGEFICFLDSDDYINYIAFSKVINYLNDDYNELIISNVNKNNKSIEKNNEKNKYYTSQSLFNEYYPLYKKDIIHLLHGKIYRKDIIKINNINFPTNLTVGEDFIFNLRYISKINKIMKTNTIYYNYFINKKSVTRNYEKNIMNNKLFIINYLKKIYLQFNLSLKSLDVIKIQSIYAALLNLFRLNSPKYKLIYINKVRNLASKYKMIPHNYRNKNFVYLILMLLLNKSSNKFLYIFLILVNKFRKI